ncbi:MAG: fluoride efflux transporter CrcB [Desulfovibrionaceae bacterium]
MHKLLLIAAAGGCGSLARYGLAGLVQRLAGSDFPYGTFAVNITGCLLFGAVWGVLENRMGLGPQVRVIVLTGFMGAFTTFSTFAFESAALLQHGQWLPAAANIAGQNLLGITMIFAGLMAGRAL